MAGISVICVGRIGAPAAAAIAAKTNRAIIVTCLSSRECPAVKIAKAVAAALAARMSPRATRIRSPRKRSSSVPAPVPAITAGTIRTAPEQGRRDDATAVEDGHDGDDDECPVGGDARASR